MVEAHEQLPINTSFKEEANTLDRGPLPSSDVAESHLATVKAPVIFETLTQIKILFIKRAI